jgi:predicted translin family RNA/ssDNA-binding protein
MINKKFFQSLHKDYAASEGERRQIISASNIVLHNSKRAIFSLHRGEVTIAESSIKEIEEEIGKLNKRFGWIRLNQEGAYRASIEEFVEAKTFLMVITGQKLDKFKGLSLPHEAYLGGICDLTGELVRRAVNLAAAGQADEAVKIKAVISDILAELVQFDMGGYLRTKYDQAKTNMRKIEQVHYELMLRRGNSK